MAQINVRNKAGETVGKFCDSASFSKWRARMQKQLGGKIGVAIADTIILDTAGLVNTLPPGRYDGVLLRKAPLPKEARKDLSNCDLWQAI